MITGIYMFINKSNNKKYIGQSIDCNRRYAEHKRSGDPEHYSAKNERDSNTPIHRAFQKYGFENFDYIILEECSKENLDKRERYWISFYHSTDKSYGYNLSEGGQDTVGAKRENHSQAKLTLDEVSKIKKLLKETDLSLTEIQKQFSKVGKSMICLINTGKNWSEPNENYPLRKTFKALSGEKSPNAKFTNDEVMEMRTLYSQGVPNREIYKMYPDTSENTIKAILYGKSYKKLPYWNNSQQKWIEPCIDYSQSLK